MPLFNEMKYRSEVKSKVSPTSRKISVERNEKEENRHGGNKSTYFPVGETGMRGSLSLVIVSSMPRSALLKKRKKEKKEKKNAARNDIKFVDFGVCTWCVYVHVCVNACIVVESWCPRCQRCKSCNKVVAKVLW